MPEKSIENRENWDVAYFSDQSLHQKDGHVYVSLDSMKQEQDPSVEDTGGDNPSNSSVENEQQPSDQTISFAESGDAVIQTDSGEVVIDEQVFEEIEDNSQQENAQGSVNYGFSVDDDSSIGYVSDAWKKAGACLFFGNLSFLIGVAVLFLFTVTQLIILLYGLGIITLIYGAFRLGISYYVYVDAKLLRFHSRKRREETNDYGYGWEPRAVFWALATFFLPPFVQYAPMIMYVYRRRLFTGVP